MELIAQLGYSITSEGIARKIAELAHGAHDNVLVAELHGQVVGMLSWHLTPVLHEEPPLGRITALVVREDVRGRSIGVELLQRAERELRERGCRRLELTSGRHRVDAHRFYVRCGFEERSLRLVKELDGRRLTEGDRARPGPADGV